MSFLKQFESRKKEHIRLALDPRNEALGESGLDLIQLQHEALPELNFDEISLETKALGQKLPSPFFVSSMTAGHQGAIDINKTLAFACAESGWLMGVGSQRRELEDEAAGTEWKNLRQIVPKVKLIGNIGLSQLIITPVKTIQRLVDNCQAIALFVHTNPLQECLQPEGTPHFKGGLNALSALCKSLSVPVIVKETGCGFSTATLKRLNDIGIAAVDISGYGGTHWGRIEGQRTAKQSLLNESAETFKAWGINTANCLLNAIDAKPNYAIWGSGGVRSGLDAAKLLAMGAQCIGFAKPMLQAALGGTTQVVETMKRLEYELKIALFCTGSQTITQLQEKHHGIK